MTDRPSDREIEAAAKPRTGACANKRQPGGCQLHNLHCGYPKCDEFPADAAAPDGAQAVAVVVPNAVGVEIVWVDPPSHGRPPPGTKLYTAPYSQDAEDAARCSWTHNFDDCSWDTQCGEKHQFLDGGPEANSHRFCPYCGNAISTVDAARAARGGG